MRRLLKSFKTEINPTEVQKIKIHKTIGTCRYIYNFYLFCIIKNVMMSVKDL